MYNTSNRLAHLFLTADPKRMSTVELAHWSGKLSFIYRSQLEVWPATNEQLARPGVYILFGNVNKLPAVYVGEGDNVYKRVKQQLNLDFSWQDTVIFVSRDTHFTTASCQNLEHLLYQHFTASGLYIVVNSNVPEKPTISEAEQLDLQETVAIILDLMPRLTKRIV